MKIEIFPDHEEVSTRAAEIFSATITEKPNGMFGFATGSTPERLYELLVDRYKRGQITFREITTVNLDEYIGLPANHEQSYAAFMQRHLFGQVDIRPNAVYFPDAKSDPAKFDQFIQNQGGIDLQILGLGANGHIGFNEPASPFGSRTRIVDLASSTIQDNSRFFNRPEDVPRQAVTMGIRTIMEARRILLLASGANKSDAVAHCLEAAPTEKIPGSCLQSHSNVTILLDEAAASKLNTQ